MNCEIFSYDDYAERLVANPSQPWTSPYIEHIYEGLEGSNMLFAPEKAYKIYFAGSAPMINLNWDLSFLKPSGFMPVVSPPPKPDNFEKHLSLRRNGIFTKVFQNEAILSSSTDQPCHSTDQQAPTERGRKHKRNSLSLDLVTIKVSNGSNKTNSRLTGTTAKGGKVHVLLFQQNKMRSGKI